MASVRGILILIAVSFPESFEKSQSFNSCDVVYYIIQPRPKIGDFSAWKNPGGTAIKIKIPLTLAIVRAVIVQASGKRFAIPQVSIQELVRWTAIASARTLNWSTASRISHAWEVVARDLSQSGTRTHYGRKKRVREE